jgi:hypothetical protein
MQLQYGNCWKLLEINGNLMSFNTVEMPYILFTPILLLPGLVGFKSFTPILEQIMEHFSKKNGGT